MWDSMSDSGRGIWLLLISLGVGGACLYGARALYTWWTGIELPSNLLELTGGIIRGQQPRAVAVLALLILLTGVAGLVGIARWRHRGPRRRKRGDRVARKSASRRPRRHPGWVSWPILLVCRSGAWSRAARRCFPPGNSCA